MWLRKSMLCSVVAVGFGALAPVGAHATNYRFLTSIAIPPASSNTSGQLTSFDISYYDPLTNLYVLGDRSNAGIDIISGTTLNFLGRATGFAGFVNVPATSGPDGVVIAHTPSNQTILFGGDAGSTLRAFTIANPSSPVPLYSTNTGGGPFRVDEMAYSPSTNLLLVANNANTPAFGTLINASTGAIVHGNITVPGGQGLEQPVWDPHTNSFYISVPSINGDAGGVAQINANGTVGHVYDLQALSGGAITACSPAGLALGSSGNLLVGCGTAGTQTVLLNPTANGGAGKIVATNSAVSGSDEVYFNPTLNDFYVTGLSGTQRVFGVLADNASLALLQDVNLPDVNAHSIAVNPGNNEVFVPLEASASNNICPNGCVAVYATVPEPASLPLFAGAIAALGAALRRRRWLERPGR